MPRPATLRPNPEVPVFAPVVLLLCVLAVSTPGALRLATGVPVWLEATRALGLASLVLWALSLVLMLRLRSLEEALGGLDRLYYLHHLCGGLAYLALLAHPLPLFLASAPGHWLPSSGWAVAAGWVAMLAMMAMMLATFLMSLGYARWKQVHAVSAPAFVLAGVHALALAPAALSLDSVLAGLALLVGCACLAIRYMMEAGRLRSLPYRVEHVAHPAADITEVVLSPDRLMVRPRPGQFVFVAFFDGRNFHGCGEFHPFTVVSSEPGSGRFTLLVKALGDCTAHLRDLEAGTRARVEGPYGSFLATIDPARPQLWIAGGIGITPFVSAAAARPPAAESVDLFYLVSSPQEAVGLERLQELAGSGRHLKLHCFTGEDDFAHIWQKIREQLPDLRARQVFMCGPPALVDGLRLALTEAGVAQSEIHSERFDFR